MGNFGVIICAGGSGSRFGGSKKKPFVEVAGRTAFLRSVDFFAERDDVKQVLIAIPPEEEEMAKIKWGATLSFMGAKFCHGGGEGFEGDGAGAVLARRDAAPAVPAFQGFNGHGVFPPHLTDSRESGSLA